jgi:DNA-3-methyladenine glycosylase II
VPPESRLPAQGSRDGPQSPIRRVRFALHPRAPFRLDLTAWALRRRAHNAIDRFDDGAWRRVLVLGGAPHALAVRQVRGGARPELEVVIAARHIDAAARARIADAVTRVLGLEVDLAGFYRLARRDRRLDELAERLRGIKPPRFPSNFEALANAVACQQVSLSAGLHVLNRLAEMCGRAADNAGLAMHSFAVPSRIARESASGLRAIGLSHRKGQYLIDLARLVPGRRWRDFTVLEGLSDAAVVQRMSALAGVGRWTAEYLLLRGFGRIHVFPADDVGGRNKLWEWMQLRRAPTYSATRDVLERFHPYGGLIYLHLLVSALADGGHVAA